MTESLIVTYNIKQCKEIPVYLHFSPDHSMCVDSAEQWNVLKFLVSKACWQVKAMATSLAHNNVCVSIGYDLYFPKL